MRVAACGGVLPFDVAFGADDDFVLAWIIAKGENEGGTFAWHRMQWVEK
ncbi:MAG: hypothetical protein ACRECA_07895 [Pseudolabrys sp.]